MSTPAMAAGSTPKSEADRRIGEASDEARRRRSSDRPARQATRCPAIGPTARARRAGPPWHAWLRGSARPSWRARRRAGPEPRPAARLPTSARSFGLRRASPTGGGAARRGPRLDADCRDARRATRRVRGRGRRTRRASAAGSPRARGGSPARPAGLPSRRRSATRTSRSRSPIGRRCGSVPGIVVSIAPLSGTTAMPALAAAARIAARSACIRSIRCAFRASCSTSQPSWSGARAGRARPRRSCETGAARARER